jgi:hypothetical protein
MRDKPGPITTSLSLPPSKTGMKTPATATTFDGEQDEESKIEASELETKTPNGKVLQILRNDQERPKSPESIKEADLSGENGQIIKFSLVLQIPVQVQIEEGGNGVKCILGKVEVSHSLFDGDRTVQNPTLR